METNGRRIRKLLNAEGRGGGEEPYQEATRGKPGAALP